MRVFGIAGFKNAGKTTLIVELLRELNDRGLKLATIKHAHHNFDIDIPGKDSYQHREAGASEVIVSSGQRWAHMTEVGDGSEPGLAELLGKLGAVDLVLVEGYKRGDHPKLEVRRADQNTPYLSAERSGFLAIVCDAPLADAPVPVLARDDITAIADFILGQV